MKQKDTDSAFTLIELLVVIAVIGVLSSVVLVSLNTSRAKARDAQRKANAYQIQEALLLYFHEHNNFPLCGNYEGAGTEWAGFTTRSTDANWDGCLAVALRPFINPLPKDMINANSNGLALYYYYLCLADSPTATECGNVNGVYINIFYEASTPNLLALTIKP